MKYIKSFQEASLYREVDIKITDSVYTVTFEGQPSTKHDYRFQLDGYTFSCFFLNRHRPIEYWEGAHGYFEENMFGAELNDREMNLSYRNTLNLMQLVGNVASKFLTEQQPNIIVFNHRDMNNETDKDKFKTQLNKRAKIIYNHIKNIIPNNYILSYWYNNFYQDDNDRASTTCIIYKHNANISELIENRIKIEL